MTTSKKAVFAINTTKAINTVGKAEQAYLKAQGGLAQAIMADLREAGAHLPQAVVELREVIKASDLTASTKEQYSKQIGRIGKSYHNSAEIPAGDLKAIYDMLRETAANKQEAQKGGKATRKARPAAAKKEAKPVELGEKLTLSTLRSIPNILAKQGVYSMKAKELYQAFLVQIDMDFKAKAQADKK